MCRLYLYACSFGLLGQINNKISPKENWVNEHSFGYIIAKRLNLTLVNRSVIGASNFKIFENLNHDLKNIFLTENDIVIVQWTHIDRSPMRSNHTIMPHYVKSKDRLVRETAETYYKELYFELQNLANIVGYTKYFTTKLGSNFYFNFVDDHNYLQKIDYILYKDFVNCDNYIGLNNQGIYEFLGSFNNTDVYFPCSHPSKLGHQMIAEYYINSILEKRKKYV